MAWVYGVDVREVEPGEFQALAETTPDATGFGRSEAEALAEMKYALVAVVRGRMKLGDSLEPPPAAKSA